MEKQEIQWFDENYPQKLLEIKKYPERLHCIGNIELLNNKIGVVAIVGSRNCTEYGRKYARIFAEELSRAGITIISGLAIGIDTEAHLGALKQQGNTIAVIGGGLNHITPDENIWLYHKIINNNGLLITECQDDEEIKKTSYQKRNRIISGMADAVLVVEASKQSGSLITAKHAKEQNKPLFCIPNRIDADSSSGIHYLIEEGATIVTSPTQIKNKILKQKNNEIKNIVQEVEIPEKYKNIYNLLEYKKTREEIAMILNKQIAEINSQLTMMELEGYIKQIVPNTFERM